MDNLDLAVMFVVFDSDHVWGLGATENEAFNDAEQWVSDAYGDFDARRSRGELIVAKASKELVALIENKGGENIKLRKDKDGKAHLLLSKLKDES